MIITFTSQEGGERLDALLARSAGITRSAAQRIIDKGLVTRPNSKALKKSHITAPGENFAADLPEPERTAVLAQEIELDVVFEDGDIIVVNKPRGMVVHPAPGHPDETLVNALLHRCGDSLSGIGGEKRPGIVHRIDKDTSGLIIAAKNDLAHQDLSRQLAGRTLKRGYEAIVIGKISVPSGTICAPIGRHRTDRKRMAVTDRSSRHAVTHYEVIARYRGYSHIRCELETGRTHQIRVHMAHIGHPLLGDLVYGRKKPEKGLSGQCLHARTLRFTHPRTGGEIELEIPLPGYFLDVIEKLGAPE